MHLGILSLILRFGAQLGCILLMAAGSWLVFGSNIKNMIQDERHYMKLEKTISAKRNSRQNPLVIHIRNMLTAVRSRDTKGMEAHVFIALSIAIFIFSILISHKIFSLLFSIGVALIITSIPYLLVRLKLRTIRIDSSYDADTIVTGITNEYKQHSLNMKKAVENCTVRFDIGANSRRVLYRLSLALKDFQDEEDLDTALAQFVYAYDTEWAVLLRNNIKMAVHRGIDVSPGLEDILKKLKDIREQIEVSKRYNTETNTMIRFLLVPLYLGSILMATKTFGFTLRKFLEYQFLNVAGQRMAVITYMSIIISFMALKMIRKPKYDI